MRKLQKIKELERRRDCTEKYYTQEIRRLIGDQYLDGKTISHPSRHHDKVYTGDRVTPHDVSPVGIPSTNIYQIHDVPLIQNLESCGTMTTITRLNCGCVESTTRPIYTTTSGRVQKRSCPQEQQVHMKLSTPNFRMVNNHPQSGISSSTTPKLKSKSYNAETRNTAATGNNGNKETTAAGRSVSPTRKVSDSSVYSAWLYVYRIVCSLWLFLKIYNVVCILYYDEKCFYFIKKEKLSVYTADSNWYISFETFQPKNNRISTVWIDSSNFRFHLRQSA